MTGLKIIRGPVFGLALFVCLLAAAGCSSVATQKAFYEPIHAELRSGNYSAVVAGVEKALADNKYKEKDRFIYFLDAGLANHYATRYGESNLKLSQAEGAADELFTRSISRAAASLVLNDNILEYSGEDYEVLYTNLIMALNYIALDDFEGAFVEVRRANEKLNLLEQKYRQASDVLNDGPVDDSSRVDINYEAEQVRFNNSAFARYLSMHMYAAAGKYDDAELDYDLMRRAFIEQPEIYYFDMPEVAYRADEGGILSVVALVGGSPVKEALNLRLRTDKDLDLVQIMYDDPERKDSEYGHFIMEVNEDYYFKFALPEVVATPSVIGRVEIRANGRVLGNLQLLEDVVAVAGETFRAKKSLIYLRSVARAVVKGLAAHGMKKKADDGGAGGWLKKLAIDAVTDFSENADLRCSRLLPGQIHIADFKLAPGTYDIEIEYFDIAGVCIQVDAIPGYEVRRGDFNLVESYSLK